MTALRIAVLVSNDRLSPKLIAVANQRVDVDGAGPLRPEAPATGYIMEITCVVGRAQKLTLPGLIDLGATVARQIALRE